MDDVWVCVCTWPCAGGVQCCVDVGLRGVRVACLFVCCVRERAGVTIVTLLRR